MTRVKRRILAALENTGTPLSIAACIAISLTCSFYFFEEFQPYMDVLRAGLCALFAFAWLWYTAANAYRHKAGFFLFFAAYWTQPQFIYGWSAGLVSAAEFNRAFYMLEKASAFFAYYPLKMAAGLIGTTPELLCLWLVAVLSAVFIAFYILRLYADYLAIKAK